MGVYTEAFYHFVWATRKREWFITEAVERDLHRFIHRRDLHRFIHRRDLHRFIHSKCHSLRVHIYALNGMPDHVHLVVGLPAALSVSDFMEAVKGTSAHYINHLPSQPDCLYWQPGYGLLTFSQNDLTRFVTYVEKQKQHHKQGTLSSKMERTADWEINSQPHEVGVFGVRAQ